MIYLAIFLALIGGVFISVQGGINGMMGNEVGIFPTVIIPVATQIIILSFVILFNNNLWQNVLKIKDVKFGLAFLIISALLGLGIMSSLTFSIMKIGPLVAFAIVIFSQLLTSMILEHYGFFKMAVNPISGFRLLGLGAMLVGIILFYR